MISIFKLFLLILIYLFFIKNFKEHYYYKEQEEQEILNYDLESLEEFIYKFHKDYEPNNNSSLLYNNLGTIYKEDDIELNDDTYIKNEELNKIIKNLITLNNSQINLTTNIFENKDNFENTLYIKDDLDSINLVDVNTFNDDKKNILINFLKNIIQNELKKYFDDITINISINLLLLKHKENNDVEFYHVLFVMHENGTTQYINFHSTLLLNKKDNRVYILTLRVVGILVNSIIKFKYLENDKYHLNKDNIDCSLAILDNPRDINCSMGKFDEEQYDEEQYDEEQYDEEQF